MKNTGLLKLSKFVGEIEVDGKFVTLYRYNRTTYFLCIENDDPIEFKSRKAVDIFFNHNISTKKSA